jgi:hypothetical protein
MVFRVHQSRNVRDDAELKGIDYVYLWKHLLAEAKVDLLFINTGAHVHNLPLFTRLVDDTVAYLKVGRSVYSMNDEVKSP